MQDAFRLGHLRLWGFLGETTLARELFEDMGPGMLVLADRGFTNHPSFTVAANTGADLLWRAKVNGVLPVLERFADGSFRSEIVASGDKRRQAPTAVRVIEYTLDDPGRPDNGPYRLLTTILDPDAAPANELGALYPQRWEFETMLDELKTHQRGPRVVLRSKTPDGVRQEVYGYLCTHYAIRALMATIASHESDANGEPLDPDRVSFMRAPRAARRSVRAGIGTTTKAITEALRIAATEIAAELLPVRRLRSAARTVKRKMSSYSVKRAAHRSWPQPTGPLGGGVGILVPP